MKRGARATIESIFVEHLFGFLTYEISATCQDGLIILYGDNGSGKTTILNLVFHALAPEDASGHRTFLSQVPFKRFAIDFADGHRVSVTRTNASTGPFTMAIRRRDGAEASHTFTLTRDGRVRDQDDSTYRPLLQELAELDLGLFLLPDNRRIQSTLYEEEAEPTLWHSQALQIFRSATSSEEALFESSKPQPIDLFVDQALRRATNWTRNQALTASSQGETDTNKIYAEILRRIAGPARSTRSPERMRFAELLAKAETLGRRSTDFSRFGLVTPLPIRDLLPILQDASPSKKGVITQVLSPYIRSFEARLEALEELRQALDTFSGIFSRFYNFKRLTFHLTSGIRIDLNHDASKIPPAVLSSGEKQLLLLFCNVLLARSRPSVFIIDEPELSLNIKWQRELIASLMSCVKGCDVQFLFATHSLEIISRHKAIAVRLQNRG